MRKAVCSHWMRWSGVILLGVVSLAEIGCSALDAKWLLYEKENQAINEPWQYGYYRWFYRNFFGLERYIGEPMTGIQFKIPAVDAVKPGKAKREAELGPEEVLPLPSALSYHPKFSGVRLIPQRFAGQVVAWDIPKPLVWFPKGDFGNYYVMNPEGIYEVLPIKFLPESGQELPFEVNENLAYSAGFPLHYLGDEMEEQVFLYGNSYTKKVLLKKEGKESKQLNLRDWVLPVQIPHLPGKRKRWESRISKTRRYRLTGILVLPVKAGEPMRAMVYALSRGAIALLNERGAVIRRISIREPIEDVQGVYDREEGEGYIAVWVSQNRILIYDRNGRQEVRLNIPNLPPLVPKKVKQVERVYYQEKPYWLGISEDSGYLYIWDGDGRLVRWFFISEAKTVGVGRISPQKYVLAILTLDDLKFLDVFGHRVGKLEEGEEEIDVETNAGFLDFNVDGIDELFLQNGELAMVLGEHLEQREVPEVLLNFDNPQKPVGTEVVSFKAVSRRLLRELVVERVSRTGFMVCGKYRGLWEGERCHIVTRGEQRMEVTPFTMPRKAHLTADVNGDGWKDLLRIEQGVPKSKIQILSLKGEHIAEWEAPFSDFVPSSAELIYISGSPWISLYGLRRDKEYPEFSSTLPLFREKGKEGFEETSGFAEFYLPVVTLVDVQVKKAFLNLRGQIWLEADGLTNPFAPPRWAISGIGAFVEPVLGEYWLLDAMGKPILRTSTLNPEVQKLVIRSRTSRCMRSAEPELQRPETILFACSLLTRVGKEEVPESRYVVFLIRSEEIRAGVYELPFLEGFSVSGIVTIDYDGDGKPVIVMVGSRFAKDEQNMLKYEIVILHYPIPPVVYQTKKQ